MTHALVTVLVPRDGSKTLDELMAPYNEEIEVDPYHTDADLTWAREVFGLPEDASAEDYVREARARWTDGSGAKYHVCDGQVCRVTTYNPRSKYDYFRPLERQQQSWDREQQSWDRERWALAAAKEPGSFVTYSLLLPDEGWHDRGDLGWFGSSVNEKPEWDEMFISAVERYLATGDYEAVVCDYHI